MHILSLRRSISSLFPGIYHPECDLAPVCDISNTRLYASLIGILRWLVERGHVDITCEVSMMSSHTVMPREGHLNHAFYILFYLKLYHNSRLMLDPIYPDIDMDSFRCINWTNIIGRLRNCCLGMDQGLLERNL